MNTKRQELESKLPPAPKTMLEFVFQKCNEAGIQFNGQDFIFVHRAVTEYLSNTGEGKKVMLKLLNADVVEASYTKQYYPEGFLGDASKKLDYRALIEYRGWVYKGKSYPWKMVDTEDRPDLDACEACGGLFPKIHCAQVTREVVNGRERLTTLCNHCRLFSDTPRIKDSASQKTCVDCVIRTCQFNPKKQYVLTPPKENEPPHPADVPQIEHKPQIQSRTIPSWADPRYSSIQ